MFGEKLKLINDFIPKWRKGLETFWFKVRFDCDTLRCTVAPSIPHNYGVLPITSLVYFSRYAQKPDVGVSLASQSAAMGQNVSSRSLVDFAFKFGDELEKNKTVICSPVAAQIALGMLTQGCKNQSFNELITALDISDDKDMIRSKFKNITASLKSIEGATLNMANKIYLKSDESIKPKIKDIFERVFDSSLDQLNFEDPNAAANTINEWVALQTNNLIKNIVSSDMFDDQTSMVLVNALHFKGEWVIQFSKERTKDSDFHVNKSTVIQLPQMYEDCVYMNFGVSSKLQAKILDMHYKGGESSMVIVLPDEVEGLNEMLQKLVAGHDFMADIKALENTKIDMQIPKFKAEMTINLKQILPKFGVKSIFDQNSSDIDMLMSNKKLFVSEAVQKVYIDVNEAGTEAGAATVVPMKECSSTRNPQFIADHPFLYLLLVKGIPIFVGTYYGPQA